jgi:hypothetical protein
MIPLSVCISVTLKVLRTLSLDQSHAGCMAVLFTTSSILQELSDIKSALNNEIEQLRSVSITSASCKKSVTFIFRLSYFGKMLPCPGFPRAEDHP